MCNAAILMRTCMHTCIPVSCHIAGTQLGCSAMLALSNLLLHFKASSPPIHPLGALLALLEERFSLLSHRRPFMSWHASERARVSLPLHGVKGLTLWSKLLLFFGAFVHMLDARATPSACPAALPPVLCGRGIAHAHRHQRRACAR